MGYKYTRGFLQEESAAACAKEAANGAGERIAGQNRLWKQPEIF
ncbi:hypothetical protein [Gallintestinimicrobium sp.]